MSDSATPPWKKDPFFIQDMYQKLLECFPDEGHLVESFEYLRLSIDDVLRLKEDIESHGLYLFLNDKTKSWSGIDLSFFY